MADHLRHRHRGLFWRRVELGTARGPVRLLLDPLPGHAPAHQARWAVRQPAAFWHVPLAYHGPHPLPEGSESDHSRPGLALGPGWRGPLPGPPGRHSFYRVLVPDRAARPLPGPAWDQ